jgi:uncharacterized membrane protein
MPEYLPAHDLLIAVSGVAEIAGGIGLLIPSLRRAAGWGLIALLLAVFPANVEMLLDDRARGVPWWQELTLWLRLPFQGLLIWWVVRASLGERTTAEAAGRAAG